jgi:hypothetical protein
VGQDGILRRVANPPTAASYIGNVGRAMNPESSRQKSKNEMRVAPPPSGFWLLAPVFLLASTLTAAEPSPATTAAFDHYAKLTEESFKKTPAPHHWLWLDEHPKEQSLVWLGQSQITPQKTLDQEHEIEIPDASLQDWLGVVVLDGVTLERVRDFALNFGDYKYYFKQFYTDSRQVKRDGDTFDAFLRLSRKQFATVVLNLNVTASYVVLDPTHAYIILHSTHIGELAHPKEKDPAAQERTPAEAYGYQWRLNQYWRLEQTRDGVYVELESLTLSRPAGGLSPARFLNGFVQDFPREFIEGMIEALQQAFPHPR